MDQVEGFMKHIFVFAVAAIAAGASAQLWNEQGDAGDLPGTAQLTMGIGPLNFISGNLGANDADMFGITVTDWSIFSATTTGGVSIDTQLFLFTSGGMGIAFNDDSVGTSSTLPAGNALYSGRTNGEQVFLALSQFDKDPFSVGGAIFLDTPFTTVHGPDGPGGGSPITGWDSFGGNGGVYRITLTGAEFFSTNPVPEPFTMGLGIAGVAVFARRRFKKSK
jgi:hypothetical protein